MALGTPHLRGIRRGVPSWVSGIRHKVIEDLGIWAPRLARGHVRRDARAAPPVLLCVVREDARALHALLIPGFFTADVRKRSIDTRLSKELLPEFDGLFVASHARYLVARKHSH